MTRKPTRNVTNAEKTRPFSNNLLDVTHVKMGEMATETGRTLARIVDASVAMLHRMPLEIQRSAMDFDFDLADMAARIIDRCGPLLRDELSQQHVVPLEEALSRKEQALTAEFLVRRMSEIATGATPASAPPADQDSGDE